MAGAKPPSRIKENEMRNQDINQNQDRNKKVDERRLDQGETKKRTDSGRQDGPMVPEKKKDN